MESGDIEPLTRRIQLMAPFDEVGNALLMAPPLAEVAKRQVLTEGSIRVESGELKVEMWCRQSRRIEFDMSFAKREKRK